jgi:anaphase-promoting complex subunit 6
MLTSAEEANLVSSLRFGVENGWLSSFYSCLIKKYDKAENIESKFAELERLPGDLNSQETSVSYSLKNNADLIACKAEYYHQCGEYQKCFELTTTLFERDPFHLKCAMKNFIGLMAKPHYRYDYQFCGCNTLKL